MRLYRAEKLEPPESVEKATEEYRHDSDKIEQFIDECVHEVGGNACVSTKQLYRRYVRWCFENGVYAESQTRFTQAMRNKGYIVKKAYSAIGGHSNHVMGIELTDEHQAAPTSAGQADESEVYG